MQVLQVCIVQFQETIELVEQLVQVRLNSCRVSLRKEVQQLVIRDEVQAWELCSLLIKVLFNLLLNVLHLVIGGNKEVTNGLSAVLLDIPFAIERLAVLAGPLTIDHLEVFELFVAPLTDFLGLREDLVQIEPVTLENLPLLDGLGDQIQASMLSINFLFQALNVA